mgnify:CR=1 FL=1
MNWANARCLQPRGNEYWKRPILHQRLIKDFSVSEGDKIKFINLKQPNIYQCSSISFITSLPKELDFHKIIDYDVQFEKSFVEPLNFILQKINWLVDRSYGTQGTLEDFFV